MTRWVWVVLFIIATPALHAANVGVSGVADDHLVLCGRWSGDIGPCLYTRDVWVVVTGASPVYTKWLWSRVEFTLGERGTACDDINGEFSEDGWTDDGNCPQTQLRFHSGNQIAPLSMLLTLPNGSTRWVTFYFGDVPVAPVYIKRGVVESSMVLDPDGCGGHTALPASGFLNIGGCP